MSRKYKSSPEVPTNVLLERLNELVQVIAKQGRGARKLENVFVMHIPAEVDHDADLVMSEVGRRLKTLEAAIAVYCREELGDIDFETDKECVDYFTELLYEHEQNFEQEQNRFDEARTEGYDGNT